MYKTSLLSSHHSDFRSRDMKSLLFIIFLSGFLASEIEAFNNFNFHAINFHYNSGIPLKYFTNEVIFDQNYLKQLLAMIKRRKRILLFLVNKIQIKFEDLDNLKYIEM